MNKRMQKLLLDGDCLKEGIARGDVFVVLIPPQSKRNDTKMKKRSGILYGRTIFTDEQILYFYRKHDGNARAASAELRMTASGYRERLTKLGLSSKGKPSGKSPYTDKQITAAMKKTKNNMRAAAHILGCHYVTMQLRARALGLKAQGVGSTNTKYSDKQIKSALKKANNNMNAAARILGCSFNVVKKRATKLGIKPNKVGSYKRR